MRFRPLVALAALVLGAGAVVVPAVPAAACACGGVAPSPGGDVAVGEEHAIVSWRDGVEQIDLVLGMSTAETETGLVFPTPSPATVTLGDADDFAELDRIATPRVVEERDWWSAPSAGDGGAGAPPDVLARVQLGPIEAVTLAASDTQGLRDWLDGNGFALAPDTAALLGEYVDRGWSFVALRLTSDDGLAGGLEPLRFRFAADEPVYPLALSRAASIPQTVRLYVLAEHRVDAAFADGSSALASTTWAAPLPAGSFAERGSHLTVLEMFYGDPSAQIAGDLVLTRAASDAEVGTERRVRVPVAIAGIPAGPLLVGAGVVGLGVVLALVVRSARSQPSRGAR